MQIYMQNLEQKTRRNSHLSLIRPFRCPTRAAQLFP